jgi:hypothetical protein
LLSKPLVNVLYFILIWIFFKLDNLQLYELRAKYLIGLQANTFDWLLEMFQHLAQCSTFPKMYKYIDKMLNKINTTRKLWYLETIEKIIINFTFSFSLSFFNVNNKKNEMHLFFYLLALAFQNGCHSLSVN